MKKAFIDTNVIVDFLIDRPPFTKQAINIFNLVHKKKMRLFTSSHAYATAHYIVKKHIEETALRTLLSSLLAYIDIIPVDIDIIKKSLGSKHKDFEDAIQIFAANTIPGMDFIITRNLKDFKDTGLTVIPPDELLNHL